MEKKPIVLSGIQPSGQFTIGNYLGAIKTWSEIQEQNDCVFMIANLHATTVKQDPQALKQHTLEGFAMLLAAGVDPNKSIMFIQSQNPHHAQLMWALNCNTGFGELSRMTQFKDKSARYADNINAGLFTYPTLMAADILLYQANFVPVGSDQKQHVELARDIATRMNSQYPGLFTMPECVFPSHGVAKVMSLADPSKKMSKSDPNPKGFVAVLDPKDVVIKKFKSAVTDSGSGIYRADDKPGISNLMNIYGSFTGKTDEEIVKEFEGKGYGDFKQAVGETVADFFTPIRDNFARYMADPTYLKECYTKGLEMAMRLSGRTLEKTYKKMGFFL